MSRTERLLHLLQVLRRRRHPVSGQVLAHETGISIRTLYRDIATLQSQGAAIEGEPGVGYVMKPGFMLPPLMFRSEERDALVLGMRWVADRGDRALADGASSALAKIAAVLPADLRRELQDSALLVGKSPGARKRAPGPDALRHAIRDERRLEITYRDAAGNVSSSRVVWPFALVYFDQARVLACWCEQRADFRHFRTDRILHAELLGSGYPRRRHALLKAWRESARVVKRRILPDSDSSDG